MFSIFLWVGSGARGEEGCQEQAAWLHLIIVTCREKAERKIADWSDAAFSSR